MEKFLNDTMLIFESKIFLCHSLNHLYAGPFLASVHSKKNSKIFTLAFKANTATFLSILDF